MRSLPEITGLSDITLHIAQNDEIDRTRWDSFIRTSPQGSIFAITEYMDIIRPDWKAWIISNQGEWLAVMPFCENRRWRYRSIPQPMFAQHWGTFFKPMGDISPRKQLTLKKDILEKITEEMKDIHLVVQNFSPAFDYPLPFFWAGFDLKTRYTYQLALPNDMAELRDGLSPSLRRRIQQTIKAGYTVEVLTDHQEMTRLFVENRESGHNIAGDRPEDYETITRLGAYLDASGWGKTLAIRDNSGRLMAASTFVTFEQKGMYLMGAIHPQHSHPGAGARLMWEGIRHCVEKDCQVFDFEGSMIPGVEEFFRKFGAIPVPYLQIHKNRLPLLLQWIQELRSSVTGTPT